ncbi:hypothetical protein ABVT39_006218, partial [Epinephelus coioides]
AIVFSVHLNTDQGEGSLPCQTQSNFIFLSPARHAKNEEILHKSPSARRYLGSQLPCQTQGLPVASPTLPDAKVDPQDAENFDRFTVQK